MELDRTYQLNFGGNMDFMNMLERERLTSKKISKTQSVTVAARGAAEQGATSTSARPTTCRGSRTASGRRSGLEGRELRRRAADASRCKLEVWDSPNSAGVIIDAVRVREGREGPRHRRAADRSAPPTS